MGIKMDNKDRLAYLPASFFGMVMGLTGMSIAFLKLAQTYQSVTLAANVNVAISVIVMVALSAAYLYKMIRFRAEVKAELKHPIKMNFIPTISISLLLLSIAAYSLGSNDISFYLWIVGTLMQISLTYWVLYNWVHHDFFTPEHSNPAWFIPIVGNIIVPIAGVHHAPLELNWFFFSVGIIFWIVVKSILINRIIFHAPMPEKLIPTLFIFIAPPAVGFVAYIALNQELNQFAMVLYYFALAMTLLMLISAHKFMRLSFALSWWAFTFPVAAIVIASYLMSELTHHSIYLWIGIILHAFLVLLVLKLIGKTLQAMRRKQICTDQH